jgi:hypothetical protein
MGTWSGSGIVAQDSRLVKGGFLVIVKGTPSEISQPNLN